MSQLSQLKSAVSQVASTAKTSGGQLQGFTQGFNAQISEVQGLIGGSAQRADQQVIQALQGASQAVQQAVSALENAARTASQYAEGI